MILQKEARLGGVLCLYSGLIKMVLCFCFKELFFLDRYIFFDRDYQWIIYDSFGWIILATVAVFLWSYGYDSQSVNDTKYKKINYVFCYVMGVVGVIADAVMALLLM